MVSVPDPTLVYGPIVGVYDVDHALIDLLKKWMQSYLNEIARQHGEDFARLVKPRSFRAGPAVEFLPEDQRPCCIVSCQGFKGPSMKFGHGPGEIGQRVQATWAYQVGFSVVAKGKKNISVPRAHELVMMYTAAARMVIEHHSSEQLDMAIDWIDEGPGEMNPEADRSAAVGIVELEVTVLTTHIKGIGPVEPEADPPFDSPVYPEVLTYDLDIEKWSFEPPIPPSPPTNAFPTSFTGEFD